MGAEGESIGRGQARACGALSRLKFVDLIRARAGRCAPASRKIIINVHLAFSARYAGEVSESIWGEWGLEINCVE